MRPLIERRYDEVWKLRNAGKTHRQIARKLGITTPKVRAIIEESMDSKRRDTLVFGERNTPEHFHNVELSNERRRRKEAPSDQPDTTTNRATPTPKTTGSSRR